MPHCAAVTRRLSERSCASTTHRSAGWRSGIVRSPAVADEVVQETWLGVVHGIGNFEGRSSLRTWIFRILTNTAKTRAEREGRTVPLSAFASDDDDPSVDPSRFLDQQHERWPGHWASPPTRWDELPEEHLAGRETLDALERAIDALPPVQQAGDGAARHRGLAGRKRSATCSASASAISGSACIGRAPACGRRSKMSSAATRPSPEVRGLHRSCIVEDSFEPRV